MNWFVEKHHHEEVYDIEYLVELKEYLTAV